jgi:hypothetical protein
VATDRIDKRQEIGDRREEAREDRTGLVRSRREVDRDEIDRFRGQAQNYAIP